MIDLNDDKLISSIDKSGMLSSIKALPDQCRQAWDEVNQLKIPANYNQVKNIVVSGMGGSALGSHIFYSLFFNKLSIPLTIVNGYHLPASVNKNSLVLLSTYSGTTEETLSCAKEAKEKNAKILGITTGGKLGQFLNENNFPGYIFKPKYNPCNQPRMGLGYSVLGQIALLMKCGLITISQNQITDMIKMLVNKNHRIKEKAKETAKSLAGKIPVIISADFLAGNAHVFANQLNENAKTFSAYFFLPEINHHLLEGLKNPSINAQVLILVFLNSSFYEEKVKKRFTLTKGIAAKNNLTIIEFQPESKEKLTQVFEVLSFGSFVGFYLSILYHQDPSPIPWVDYFKDQLKK